jgi:hypothetical protein
MFKAHCAAGKQRWAQAKIQHGGFEHGKECGNTFYLIKSIQQEQYFPSLEPAPPMRSGWCWANIFADYF